MNDKLLRVLCIICLLGIKVSSGTVAFAYQIPDTSSTILLSSPALITGTSCTAYTGGTLTSWSSVFQGLYVGPTGYSGGTSRATFNISSALTSVNF